MVHVFRALFDPIAAIFPVIAAFISTIAARFRKTAGPSGQFRTSGKEKSASTNEKTRSVYPKFSRPTFQNAKESRTGPAHS